MSVKNVQLKLIIKSTNPSFHVPNPFPSMFQIKNVIEAYPKSNGAVNPYQKQDKRRRMLIIWI